MISNIQKCERLGEFYMTFKWYNDMQISYNRLDIIAVNLELYFHTFLILGFKNESDVRILYF